MRKFYLLAVLCVGACLFTVGCATAPANQSAGTTATPAATPAAAPAAK